MSFFENTTRVSVACSNCRKRKVKCITESTATACYRCRIKELCCEYVATEKQARSTSTYPDNSLPGNDTPMPPVQQPNPSHHISSSTSRPFNSGTFVPGHAADAPRMNAETSGLYRPPHQRSPINPSFPRPPPTNPYENMGLTRAPPSVPMSQPYASAHPSAFYNVPAQAQYPPGQAYPSNSNWPSSTSSYPCVCPVPGPCYCGGYRY